ncbi:lytic transglycosylase domain-containing protein [Bradyrhizobium sp. CCBAU 11361]|uniref:lytic transglycosylase domain-containing protein n=1 Tax=Bradyrhizobium sp. CCBAU 11361 TaxID=1630812 RepID=UPI003FA4BF76
MIDVESGGKVNAVSTRGALGLMQIMPQTWIDLSVRHDLGLDPFDPHDNIVAGTAYLREMLDRFGTEGFLAAYNAGPKRYEEHLVAGRTLPDETQAYVRRLAVLLGISRREHGRAMTGQIVDAPQATVFVRRSGNAFANVHRHRLNNRSVRRNTLLRRPHQRLCRARRACLCLVQTSCRTDE